MSGYRALETLLIVLAILGSAGYAMVHLAPTLAAEWRKRALLWLIAEGQIPTLRRLGRHLAMRGRRANAQTSACGSCKGCSPRSS